MHVHRDDRKKTREREMERRAFIMQASSLHLSLIFSHRAPNTLNTNIKHTYTFSHIYVIINVQVSKDTSYTERSTQSLAVLVSDGCRVELNMATPHYLSFQSWLHNQQRTTSVNTMCVNVFAC